MSIARELKRGHRHLHRELRKPVFTWNGQTLPCTQTTAAHRKELGPGGIGLESDLTLFVAAELFPNARPQPEQRLAFQGKTYRIASVDLLPGDALLKLVCEDPAKNLGAD